MRQRNHSGLRLEIYRRLVQKTILAQQNPVTGLITTDPNSNHAWVRDNCYSILAVWGLSVAYRKHAEQEESESIAYELEQACVKNMRGILMCLIQQRSKVEAFKKDQKPLHCLHAKYSAVDWSTVVGDAEWGHLQIDATSLFLLMLAQMTASGLQIIFNLDEVAFIQNLVFYIENAYCVPDYGIWERGDKTNHGVPELNASSIGMAKAALEALNDLDLFGARGGPSSVIHVLADEAQKCQAVLKSLLPRESNSKEVDSALLSIIGFPAFAVEDVNLIKLTLETITEKLLGRYGCKRFMRDGFKTAREDPKRLYYEPHELSRFENIENEWPLFLCYLTINAWFMGDHEAVEKYGDQLEEAVIMSGDGIKLIPEMYGVPHDLVEAEIKQPHSQKRVPVGRKPHLWSQSLYVISCLLREGFIAPGELDPLNRRLAPEKKPDVVVQVVVLAEDANVQSQLRSHDIQVKTVDEVQSIDVQPAKVLSHLYHHLGYNQKLDLSGRHSHDVGILSTSKLYSLQGRLFAFAPQFVDKHSNFMANDSELAIDILTNEINFLQSNWQHQLGRPTVFLVQEPVTDDFPVALITFLKKLKSGYINGTRVVLGNVNDFLSTSCFTSLSFLADIEGGNPERLHPAVQEYLETILKRALLPDSSSYNRSLSFYSQEISPWVGRHRKHKPHNLNRRMSVKGTIRRTRNIVHEEKSPAAVGVAPSTPLLCVDENASMPSTPISTMPPPLPFSPVSLTDATGHLQPPDAIPESGVSLHSIKSVPALAVVPANQEDMDWEPMLRTRTASDSHFENTETEDLLNMLKESQILEEKGDILHYLVLTVGFNYDTGARSEDGQAITVRTLLKDLYEKACKEKEWGLVRHTAGMLGKRVEDLAKSVTDLLVRQKQVTVGMPPSNERTITAPLPHHELRQLIHTAYGDDESSAMLTQELLLYLGMFIRTDPHLFTEVLRLRVGLIIQVMAQELARGLGIPAEDGSDKLLDLSPYDMKSLLFHIMSGKEFSVGSRKAGKAGNISIASRLGKVSKKSDVDRLFAGDSSTTGEGGDTGEEIGRQQQGQWLRRRRLDGALNRVPTGFYSNMWSLLGKCQGLSIEGRVLPPTLTREMTAGELKFALHVETVLNTIPQPEYRQLMVEAMMVLMILVDYKVVEFIDEVINVEQVVHAANKIFLDEQVEVNGDAMLCCASGKSCQGAAYICVHFYDSAPSGSYGTMTYLIKAMTKALRTLPCQGQIDCVVS